MISLAIITNTQKCPAKIRSIRVSNTSWNTDETDAAEIHGLNALATKEQRRK